MSNPESILQGIRQNLQSLGLAAYFLPHNDPHNSEYLADHDKRMDFISGFTGSNGVMLITSDHAFLWTDSRYFIQAEQELYPGWTLMKYQAGVPRYNEWIIQNLPKGSVIGYDGNLVSKNAAENRTKQFKSDGYEFVPIEQNIVNDIWTSRPPLSDSQVIRHLEQYCGQSYQEKTRAVAEKVKDGWLFLTALDDVAWILNLRGSDIEYNPVFFAYVLLKFEQSALITCELFINQAKLENVREYLNEIGVVVKDYHEVRAKLAEITEKVYVDADECNINLYNQIKEPVHKSPNPVQYLKSIKNPREIQGMTESHVRDGASLVRFFYWVRQQLLAGVELDEVTAADELERLRSLNELYMGLSFETISSSGPNGAIVHYAPKRETARKLNIEEGYLVDSGAQYLDGTIDTTRTVHFGNPPPDMKDAYTRVLLGNLDLERAKWPKSNHISGADLDILARRWLWNVGLDYGHGTGHGVGYFLNVHEGPQGISKGRNMVLQPGMNVTDEPGFYLEGSYGIRIENVLFVVEDPERAGFLGFKNITMYPYDRRLIDLSLLSEGDLEYIDRYHQEVFNTLSPVLQKEGLNDILEWLRQETAPLRQQLINYQ